MAALKKVISWLWPVRVKRFTGKISPVLEVTFEQGKKVLNAGEVNYSYGALHEVFRRALKRAGVEKQKPKEVLILGFGAGSIAGILTDEYKLDVNITGVEADEEVIRIGREEFNTARFTTLELLHAKAEDFVQQTKKKFDLICVDVFVESRVPQSCRTEAFISALYQLLNKNGKVVFNEMPSGSFSNQDELAQRFGNYFDEAEVYEIAIGGAPNRIFIASRKK